MGPSKIPASDSVVLVQGCSLVFFSANSIVTVVIVAAIFSLSIISVSYLLCLLFNANVYYIYVKSV